MGGWVKRVNSDGTLFSEFIEEADDESINVLGFGADSEGNGDSTKAVVDVLASQSGLEKFVYFPPGTYKVRGAKIADLDRLTIIGDAKSPAKILMTEGGDASTIARWFDIEDCKKVFFRHLRFDGNRANVSSDSELSAPQPLKVEWTSDLATADGANDHQLEVHFDNVRFSDSPSVIGNGCVSVKAYESATTPWVTVERVTLRDVYCEAFGQQTAVRIRGPVLNVVVENYSGRDDGANGYITCAASVEGYSGHLLGISAEVAHNHYIENLEIRGFNAFRTGAGFFLQMVKNYHIQDVVLQETSINPYWETTSTVSSVDTASNELTTVIPTYGTALDTFLSGDGDYGVGSQITLSTTGTLPAGLSTNTPYWVDAVTGSEITLEDENGDVVNITDSGSGTHTINWVAQGLQTCSKEDDCKFDPDDPGKHNIDGFRVIDPAARNRAYSVESTAANTATAVKIRNAVTQGSMSLSRPYPGQRHLYDTVYAIANPPRWNASWNSGVIGGRHVDYRDVTFIDGSPSVVPEDDTVVLDNCRFDDGVELAWAGSGGVIQFNSCEFNVGDQASRFISTTPPSSGDYDIYLDKCNTEISNTNDIELRILAGGTVSTLAYKLLNCTGISIGSSGQEASADIVNWTAT